MNPPTPPEPIIAIFILAMVTCLRRGMGGKWIAFAVRAAAAVALALCGLAVQAQAWPTKPVKFIVPFPAGGSVDPLARLLGVRLANSLGQPLVVENKPGASGSIGTAFFAKRAPDGYTYCFVFDTHAANPPLIPNFPFTTPHAL